MTYSRRNAFLAAQNMPTNDKTIWQSMPTNLQNMWWNIFWNTSFACFATTSCFSRFSACVATLPCVSCFSTNFAPPQTKNLLLNEFCSWFDAKEFGIVTLATLLLHGGFSGLFQWRSSLPSSAFFVVFPDWLGNWQIIYKSFEPCFSNSFVFDIRILLE